MGLGLGKWKRDSDKQEEMTSVIRVCGWRQDGGEDQVFLFEAVYVI